MVRTNVLIRGTASLAASLVAIACGVTPDGTETTERTTSELTNPPVWSPIGPAPGPFSVNGRTNVVAANPANTNQLWLGTANGGVWRTTGARDLEVFWTPMTDFADSLAVGDIQLADCTAQACNSVYVGTGEGTLRRQTYFGTGILVLTPKRAPTGTQSPLVPDYNVSKFTDSERAFSGGTVHRLVVVNPGTQGTREFFAAIAPGNTSGSHPATVTHPPPADGYGIHHFDNASHHWQRLPVPPGAPKNQFFPTDLRRVALHALGNPNALEPVLFAGFAEHGIYQSRDNGATWCPLNPVPAAFIPPGCPVPVATCPATPSVPCGLPAPTRACASSGCMPPPLDGVNATEPVFDAVRLAGSDAIAGGREAVLWASVAGDLSGHVCPHSYTALQEFPYTCTGTLFVSRDGGVRWDVVNTAGTGLYNFYSHVLKTHPDLSRPDTIVYGGLFVGVSTNGGTTIPLTTSGLHTDQHDFLFAADDLWVSANDGGVFRSRDQGSSWEPLNRNLQIMQFYGGDVDNGTVCSNVVNDPAHCDAFVLAGAQDNSSMLFKGLLDWQDAPGGGDGGDAVIIDQNTAFTSTYELTPVDATSGAAFEGGDLRKFGKRRFANPRGDAFVLQPPFAYQRDANLLWLGGDLLYSTTPAAPSWAIQSASAALPDSPRFGALSQTCTVASPPESNPQSTCPNGHICRPGYVDATVGHCYPFYGDIEGTNAITAVGFSPRDQSTYVGLYDGQIWKKSSSGMTLLRAGESCVHSPPSRPGGAPPDVLGGPGTRCHPITALGVDPTVTDHDRLYVGVSGFQIPGAHLLQYDGSSFVPVATGALGVASQLDVPIQAIDFSPETPALLYLGTDRGVIRRNASGVFVKDGPTSGMPNVPVYRFAVDRTRGRLYALTHGRGAFVATNAGDPIAHLKEGWLPQPLCSGGTSGPCLRSLVVSAEGLSTPGASCTLEVRNSAGSTCASGGFVPSGTAATGVSVKVTDEPNQTSPNFGKLSTRATGLFRERQLVPVCLDGVCVGPAANQLTPMSNCGGDIASVRLTCGQQSTVLGVGSSRRTVVNPPSSVLRIDGAGPDGGPQLPAGEAPGGRPIGVDGSVVLTASLVTNGVQPPLCAVRVPYTADDGTVDVVARAVDLFNADTACRAAGVTASIPPTIRAEGEDDEPFQPILRLNAPTKTGVGVYLGVAAEPGNAGVCYNLAELPGYAKSLLDSTQAVLTTASGGALGGKVTWVESSPIGTCRLSVTTRPNETAEAIAADIHAAAVAAAIDPGVPGCPASANSALLAQSGATLASAAAQALSVCTTDAGVGISLQPREVTSLAQSVP